MDIVPWRRRPGGLDRAPPDEPMYIQDPVLDHEFSNEQGERQCISIQETIASNPSGTAHNEDGWVPA